MMYFIASSRSLAGSRTKTNDEPGNRQLEEILTFPVLDLVWTSFLLVFRDRQDGRRFPIADHPTEQPRWYETAPSSRMAAIRQRHRARRHSCVHSGRSNH